jgi:ATP-dependent helicase/nuclease subunit B
MGICSASSYVRSLSGDSVKTTTTAYGSAALKVLAGQVTELKAGDGLSLVTVVVDSNYAGLAIRRGLAARPGGIANTNVTTVRELAVRLGTDKLAKVGRQPASAVLIKEAVRATLNAEPGVFAPVANHPATVQELTAAYRELRTVPDEAKNAVAECSARASDVVRVCRQAHDRLSSGWYDDEDVLIAATEELQRNPHPEIGPVIVHMLSNLNDNQARFVAALAAQRKLLLNIGLTGDSDADRHVLTSHLRAVTVLAEPTDLPHPRACGIISASDPDDEVRAAVRKVTRWVQDGVRLGRIAILYGNADPYARLVQAHLTAAGIAFTGASVRSLGEMLSGRTLLALLALPDRSFRRPAVLGLLSDAPILDNGQSVPNRGWERLSREAGVVGGSDWSLRLPTLATSKRDRADSLDAGGHTARAEHLRRDADRADSLAAFVEGLRDELGHGSQLNSWTALAEWSNELLRKYLGDESRREAWPPDEQGAAARVEHILGHLAGLDALGGPPPNLTVFRQAVESDLSVSAGQVGRLGAGLLVGPLSITAGMTFDRVVILGMAEGRFPPKHLEDSLLSDAERAVAGGHLQLRADRVHDDHRHFLAALAGAGEAVLAWPRGDLRRSNEQPASRWLLDEAAKLSGIQGIRSDELLRLKDAPWLDNIASFADGLARTPAFTSSQDLRLAAVARGGVDNPLLTGDPTLSLALDIVRSRAGEDFTRFDGNLTESAAELIRLERVSATQLERWAVCPRHYLFTYLLDVERIEEPETQLSINALDRGTLFHAILEQFVREAIEGGHRMDAWSSADRERAREIAHLHFEAFQRESRTGRELLWRRDKSTILTELDRTLGLDNTRLSCGLRPVAAEHHFELVEVPISGDRVLYVRGAIDRIDEGDDGSIAIIDYKTGKHDDYRALTEDNPHDGGKRLQLYLYALAGRQLFPDATSTSAYYWFTKIDKLIGYPVTAQVEEDVSSAINTIVAGIEAGIFPARPSEKKTFRWADCASCSPDGLSDADVGREWKRKRQSPALALLTNLCEPEVVE